MWPELFTAIILMCNKKRNKFLFVLLNLKSLDVSVTSYYKYMYIKTAKSQPLHNVICQVTAIITNIYILKLVYKRNSCERKEIEFKIVRERLTGVYLYV